LGLGYHGELGVLLLQESLRLVELLEHYGLDPVHHTVVLVLVLEVVQEGLLCLGVASYEEGDADQDALLEELIVVQLGNVLADELDGADLDQGILLG
jgi:aldehyde:ferredoxin oxidoreductase